MGGNYRCFCHDLFCKCVVVVQKVRVLILKLLSISVNLEKNAFVLLSGEFK